MKRARRRRLLRPEHVLSEFLKESFRESPDPTEASLEEARVTRIGDIFRVDLTFLRWPHRCGFYIEQRLFGPLDDFLETLDFNVRYSLAETLYKASLGLVGKKR